MRAGYARRAITPDFWAKLAGFALREHEARGVHDELYVTAVCIQSDAGERLCALCFDLLGVTRGLTEKIRARLISELGFKAENTLVCATHTHSAPGCALDYRSDYSPEYERGLIDSALECAREAERAQAPAYMDYKRASVSHLASVREIAGGRAFDMPMPLIRLRRDAGDIIICLFACHPTVLDKDSYLYSRDLPGAAERALKTTRDILFINGACADLSTRYTRAGKGVSELERLGGIWARALDDALNDASGWTRANISIKCAAVDVRVPGSKGLGEAARARLLRELPARILSEPNPGVKHELESRLAVISSEHYGQRPDAWARVAIYDLGAFAIISMPVEARHAQAEEINAGVASVLNKPVFFAGYSNGYESYLPSLKPLDADSGYEDLASRFSPDAMSVLINGALKCAGRLV